MFDLSELHNGAHLQVLIANLCILLWRPRVCYDDEVTVDTEFQSVWEMFSL